MKTVKTTILTLTLIASFICAQATTKNNEKEVISNAITTYINAFSHGKNEGLKTILADDAKFTVTLGEKTITHTKDEVLKSLKSQTNVEQNCKTDYSIIERLPNMMIVKVNMKYALFTKEHYLTLSKEEDGWKVSRVVYNFKQ